MQDMQKGAGPSGLKPKQQAFVDEYLVDLNATQAAIRAGYSERTANEQGARLLANVSVQAAIRERMRDREERTEITQDKVLKRWWDIATADPNELVQYRRVPCRYCYGEANEYQWKTRREFEKACEEAVEKQKPIPSDVGGYGYRTDREPNPACPECSGEGVDHMHATDTRKLQGSALILFDGVKQTKDGLEIKTQDRAKALENVAKHLGMFKQDVNLGVQENNPLFALMQQVAGKTLKPVEDPDDE